MAKWFFLVILLYPAMVCFGQESALMINNSSHSLTLISLKKSLREPVQKFPSFSSAVKYYSFQKSFAGKVFPGSIPAAYKFEELGIFCKLEVIMEKAVKIPIKIRLGEVQYVEQLEGKN